MGTLLLLSLALSLDSFRASLGLGTLGMGRLRQLQFALTFGICDGLAPLAGMWAGRSLGPHLNHWAPYLGPALLACYGAYVLYLGSTSTSTDTDAAEPGPWVVFGLPLSLSLDNLVAGASLGLLGFPLPLAPLVIGAVSAAAALLGLRLGRAASRRLQLRPELIGGITMIGIAASLAFVD